MTVRHETTVVVAMSGGVDSSVAAALLVEQGYRVIGVMMRLWAELDRGEASSNKCCSLEAVTDARRVAAALDIPFYLLNVERPFKENVVDSFIQGYSDGLTPNPCLACNRTIRLGVLFDYAAALGADYLATGHYARIRRVNAAQGALTAWDGLEYPLYQLCRGVDAAKDQSYVLHMATQRELAHLLFPLGELTKPQVRELAAARGLTVASKRESQDLCFLADNDYRRFLTDWAPAAVQSGPIIGADGQVLGQHEGLAFYTIGQRKGLGIGAREPLFVLRLDAARNAVIVGPAAALGQTELTASQVAWGVGQPLAAPIQVQARIRYKAQAAPATVVPLSSDRVRVLFELPLRDITPGQGVVFYEGDACLGGGIIDRAV